VVWRWGCSRRRSYAPLSTWRCRKGTAGPALVYWYRGHQVILNNLTTGTIIAFVAYLGQLYRPMMQLANVYVEIQGAMALFDRIFEYLDAQPEVVTAPDARPLPLARGKVELRDVVFEYQPGTRALDGVTFTAEPGQLVALVGPSGAGKSTITYLVPRFYDPNEGAVLIDDHDLRDLTAESISAQIGMVTQETFLFHTSVRENLQYARHGATDEELVAACRAANIHHVIEALLEGYDTVVGERGFRLSGGEKQRVSIARAILKNPRILVLDEATSALDSTSEALIQEALEPLMKGRTSLVIAHRLSTILAADKIVVLEHGRVAEEGTHESLLALDGLYAQLYRQQFRDPTGTADDAGGATVDAGANGAPPAETAETEARPPLPRRWSDAEALARVSTAS
ncbi:MAG: ABC transporter ATP-binding protein, partial [Chloroflexi bacterium]|nr:ABC transporter ATP-binding protein [Chloroflexota bacterium]